LSIALIPVKQLSAGKSRLHPELSRERLEALSVAMLEDIVEALRGAQSVSRVVVVTPDDAVARAAEAAGAEGLLLTDPGLNPSLEAAASRLGDGDEALLVVLGDVAGVTSDEIDSLHDALAAQAGGVLLAPSSDGGTSALLRQPADVIPCRFGADSAKAHRAAAEQAGVEFRELALESLAIDLDQASDLERFVRSEGGGRRTRELLRAWRVKSA
jgi:2-phospho-L-lactate guanylyltransferase